jgi:hypothetical protein
MPETTPTPPATTTATPAPEAPARPLSKEAFLEAAKSVPGVLDADDTGSIERRFNIKRHTDENASHEASSEVPAQKVENGAGDKKAEADKSVEPPPLKVKIDGEEVELDVKATFPEFAEVWDKFSDAQKKRILAMHQKDVASNRRFSQAALTQKQLQNLIGLLKENPMAVLTHPSLNHNVRKVVEDWLTEQIEYETMDPKDRELLDAKKALKANEDKERNAKQESERKEIEALQGQYTKSYQKEIIEAIDGSGLPKSSETVARIAYYLKEALKERPGPDGKPRPGVRLKASDVVDLVRDDYERMMKRLVGQADAETLVKLFGDDVAEKFRKHLLKPIKTTGETPAKQSPSGERKGQRKKLTSDEWRKRLDERVG